MIIKIFLFIFQLYFFLSCCYAQQKGSKLLLRSGDSLQMSTFSEEGLVKKLVIKNKKGNFYSNKMGEYEILNDNVMCIFDYKSKSFKYGIFDFPYLLIALEGDKAFPNSIHSYGTYCQMYIFKFDNKQNSYILHSKSNKEGFLFYDAKKNKINTFEIIQENNINCVFYLSSLNLESLQLWEKTIQVSTKIVKTELLIDTPWMLKSELCESYLGKIFMEYLYLKEIIR